MDDNTNVASENDSAQKATDGDSSAQSNLDDLLDGINKEFDDDVKKTESPDQSERIAALERAVESFMAKESRNDVNGSVEKIMSQLESVKLPKRVIRGMLNDAATEDPRLMKAFQSRGEDPASWDKVLSAFAQSIEKEFAGQIDPKLTEDREALTTAIRGKNVQTGDDDAKMNRFFENCSDAEFAEYKRTMKIPKSYG